MWENRDACRVLVEKPEDEKPLGRPRRIFGGYQNDLHEIRWGGRRGVMTWTGASFS
jgi:hypothetical protein